MTIVIFFIVLFVLILVHEFGHFIVAKRSGIRVDEFGIGFPPKIFGRKKGETEYTLNWLPIGGFVRIFGEDPTQEHYTDAAGNERSFVSKPRYIQAAVLVAGVTMNILLAFVLYVIVFMMGAPTGVVVDSPQDAEGVQLLVASVTPETPAAEVLIASDEIVGLQRDDEVFPSVLVSSSSAVAAFIAAEPTPVTIDIIRRGEPAQVVLTPETGIDPADPEALRAGFNMSTVKLASPLPLHEAVAAGATLTIRGLRDIAVGFTRFVVDAFKGDASMEQMAGPVKIVGLVGDASALGFTWLLMFTAFISLNLAFINILPIPALDGGRLLFVLIEAIQRKPLNPVLATKLNQYGFMFLLGLIALISIFELYELASGWFA